MKNVWVQIRNGRHPGFEDGTFEQFLVPFTGADIRTDVVWPLIVQNLDFKPSEPEPTTSKSKFEGWP